MGKKRWATVLMALMVAMFMMFGALEADAANYYVSPYGSNSSSGSLNSPWATIQYAVDRTGPGDTVYVRAGSYSGGITIDGKTGDGGSATGGYWTLKNYPNEKVTIYSTMTMYAAGYVIIEGLNFNSRDSIWSGKLTIFTKNTYSATDRNHDIIIRGCTFTGPQPRYDFMDINGDRILVENNVINITSPSAYSTDHGIYLAAGRDVVIRGNTVTGSTGWGIHVYNQSHATYPTGYDYGIYGAVIEGNTVYGNTNGIIVAAGEAKNVENTVIMNNVVDSQSSIGIYLRGYSSYSATGLVIGTQIVNNTLYENASTEIQLRDAAVRNSIIKNNILRDGDGSHIAISYSASGTSASNNLYYPGSPRNVGVTDSYPVISDPWLVDPASGDFHIASNSGAKDKGVAVAVVKSDMDGIARPQGSAYDIGAYEYVSVVSYKPDIAVNDSISPTGDLQVPFGSIETGTSSNAVVTIFNKGTASLNIAGMNLTDATNFSIDVNGGAKPCRSFSPSIQPGDSCTVGLNFSPLYAGSFSTTLNIGSNDPDTPTVGIQASGTAFTPTPQFPDISVTDSVSPADDLSISFGDIETGTSSQAVVTVSNKGTAVLSVAGMSLMGATSFSIDSNGGLKPCGSFSPSIQSGDSCTVGLTFSPTGEGNFIGTLSISSNDPDTPTVSVNVSGSAHNAVSVPSQPGTYYMSATGSDASGDGSKSNPWKTLNYSNKRLVPGDTLYIRGGNYYEEDVDIAISGTASSPITIAAYPGETPHFQPAGGSGWDFVRWYTPVAYLIFDGLEVSGYSHAGIGIGAGNGIIVRNSYFHDIGANMTGAVFTGYYGTVTGTIIEGNVFENIGVDISHDHSVYVSTYSDGVIVRDNIFKDGASWSVHVYGGSLPNPANTMIYNNMFERTSGLSRKAIIVANGSGHRVDNNTFHVENAGADTAMFIRVSSGADVTSMKNNIFYGSWTSTYGYIYNLGTISGIDNNLYWPNAKDSDDKGANSFQGNPYFKDASAGDFHLQSASPAVDAGAAITAIADDMDGVARPQGSAYDIGAYEYVSVVSYKPDIAVTDSISPTGDLQVPFGSIETGTSSTAVITVSNNGTATLSVAGMSLSDTAHYLVDVNSGAKPCGSMSPSILQGESCTVGLIFRPSSDGSFGASLAISSNDPDTPTASVTISGTAYTPVIEPVQTADIHVTDSVMPADDLILDLGTVRVGQSGLAEITISNRGTASLSVYSVAISDNINFMVDPYAGSNPCGTLAPVVQPGESCSVEVIFTPLYDVPYEATIGISSNDPDTPLVSATVLGTGYYPGNKQNNSNGKGPKK